MSSAFEVIYERDGFKLGWDRKKGGKLRSPNLLIVWYDHDRRRQRSQSTGTDDVVVAKAKLDSKYTAANGGACAFCPQCGQTVADAAKHLLLDALCSYFEEVGQERVSADSIKARLKHLSAFVHDTGQEAITCADVDDRFVGQFRRWASALPVVSRNKEGVITASRPRSPATVEESVIQLKAALNHAVSKRRIESVPSFKIKGRESVTPENTTSVELETLATMLRYAAASPRRSALHAFLIGSITTLARPDAVLDISTDPARAQWSEGAHLLRLNPKGRTQTKKRRPVVVVTPLLDTWLTDTAKDQASKGWFVSWRGGRVSDVGSAWSSMLKELGLPQDREHGSYIIRRSMATILRNWHHEQGRTVVSPWDLEAQMGHRRSSTTEVYAKASRTHKNSVQRALVEVLDELNRLAPGSVHRRITGTAAPETPMTLVNCNEKPKFYEQL